MLPDIRNEGSYRSRLVKHMSFISSCAELDPIHGAKLLHAKGHLTTPVLRLLQSFTNNNKGSTEACIAMLLSTITTLSDSVVRCFVLEVLPEMGLEKVSHSIQQFPGKADCSIASNQHHDSVSE